MNLCIGIAISSSLQIGLLVTPVLVITGWIIDQPMTLFFENFETVVLFSSVLIVNYLIQDGRSNWLEGVQLLVSLPAKVSPSSHWCSFLYSYHSLFTPLLPWPSMSILLPRSRPDVGKDSCCTFLLYTLSINKSDLPHRNHRVDVCA